MEVFALTTNLEQLQALGGPFPLTQQLGYGPFYLSSTTLVSELNGGYKLVKITFTNSAGEFIPNQPIFLSPQNLIAENINLQSAHMKLTIRTIQLAVPTPEQDGQVSIDCSFSDINGSGKQDYTGVIATWTASGPKS